MSSCLSRLSALRTFEEFRCSCLFHFIFTLFLFLPIPPVLLSLPSFITRRLLSSSSAELPIAPLVDLLGPAASQAAHYRTPYATPMMRPLHQLPVIISSSKTHSTSPLLHTFSPSLHLETFSSPLATSSRTGAGSTAFRLVARAFYYSFAGYSAPWLWGCSPVYWVPPISRTN